MDNAKNRAAYMTAVREMELRVIEMPAAGPGEVVLRTEYVGVCGSDVHFFASGQRRGKPFALPFILGHECSGTVVEVGKGVEHLAVGDRITIEPQQTCGHCRPCKTGRYNMCAEVAFPSVPPHDGMLRNYMTFPAHLCYRLPDAVSTQDGALIEPLAVGLEAAKRGEVGLGTTVAILGSGCIGLTTLLACKASGASRIIVADLHQKRLDRALEMGATAVVNAQACDAVEAIREMLGGEGPDVVFETAGNKVTAAQAGKLVGRCGIVVMVGNVNGDTPFDFMDLMYKEGEIRTIYRYKNNFPVALAAVAEGKIAIDKIISHSYCFSDTQQAFTDALEKPENQIKSVIRMNED